VERGTQLQLQHAKVVELRPEEREDALSHEYKIVLDESSESQKVAGATVSKRNRVLGQVCCFSLGGWHAPFFRRL
jgi:hypothetical protein